MRSRDFSFSSVNTRCVNSPPGARRTCSSRRLLSCGGLAIEKLRGFVLDHHAEILSIDQDRVDLQIEAVSENPNRRRSDRPIPFLVELTLSEKYVESTSVDGRVTGQVARTYAHVAIRLKNSRDRRKKADVAAQATAILAGIRSYLMATTEKAPEQPVRQRRTMNLLGPWLNLRH